MRVTTNNPTDICFKSLKMMPKKFTSNYFNKTLRGLGVNEYEIINKYYYNFLKQECVYVSRMNWEKKVAVQAELANVIKEEPKVRGYQWETKAEVSQESPAVFTDAQMIEQLKAKGYKILKRAWKEL